MTSPSVLKPHTTLSQRGMSSLSLLLLLMVIAFFAVCCFRVVPLYYNNFMLNQALQNLDTPVGSINNMSNAEIREAMSKNFRINSIEIDLREITISRDNNVTSLFYDYEARTNLMYNVSVVAAFEVQYPSE